jgi:protocatechuate 3,4-dioxygenase beta subunit
MPATRASRALLLLLLVPIALVAIVALWLRDGDDDSMSGLGRFATDGEESAPAVLPLAQGDRQASPLAEAGADGAGGLAAAGGAGAALADEDAALGSVHGRLVDAAQHPVAGEPVFLVRDRDAWQRGVPALDDPSPTDKLVDTARSDAEGRFALSGAPGVTYQLFAGGTTWARTDVGTVVAGDDLTVVMREGFVLTGTLHDAATQAPLAEGWVLALSADCSQLARTAEDGSFKIGPVPELVSLVGSYATGYDIALANDVLPAEGNLKLEINPGPPVSGSLVDADTKQPLAGGEVRLYMDVTAQMTGDGGKLPDHITVDPQVAKVDSAGRFELASAPTRGFWIEVSSPGYVPDRIDTWKDQARPADGELTIELDAVEPIAGRALIGDSQRPAVGAAIAGLAVNGEFAQATTNDDGDFELDPSQWDGERPIFVTARDAEGRTARKRLGGREEQLLLQLVEPLTIPVAVVQGDSPIVGAQVAALSDGALPTLARSAADGRVTLVHELAGPETTRVVLQARWHDVQSVPVELDVAAGSPAEAVVLDLDAGEHLEGTVVDDQGNPVPTALVSAAPHPKDAANQRPAGHTDAQGRFRIGPVVPGLLWDLRIEAEGYHTKRLTELSPASGPMLVTLQSVVRWEGRVADGSTGQPLSEFQGQLLREVAENGTISMRNTRESVRRTPGRPGEFSVALPDAGKYQVRITGKDCLPADSAPIVFTGAGPAPPRVDLLLWPAAVLEVAVQDSRGRPVRGYEVAAVPWTGGAAGDAPPPEARKSATRQSTDDDGRARFNLGAGGTYSVGGGPAFWLDTQRLKVEPGSPVFRQYTLPATGDLEVSVLDDTGQPLPGVQVEVRSAKSEKSHQVMRRAGSRSGSSVVSFENLPVGDYTIRLRRRSYTADPSDTHVRANLTERLTLEMQPRPPVKAGPP